ncbi:GNAT family N-acetyltransferase [Shouchella lonarensis]|uniref:Protein N-acetyltransferase, RimJ/RimL family n=1 Tax=Shouchella lonarensis TaxID=1464122 RepID=A0A1G6NE17_9BACI|nr:Protein N-acetyltransferase, RimJ/RimL family [Shouchella lonarensis]
MTVQAETDRLILRPYRLGDYENWHTQVAHSFPSNTKHDQGRPSSMETYTKTWFAQWVSNFDTKAGRDEMYHLGIFRKGDGVNVGKVELYTILRMDYQWAMMGYAIHNQFWRLGFGVESVIAAREVFFKELQFHRIECHIPPDNTPSIHLAEKAGFQFECTRKAFSYEDGRWADYFIYYRNNDVEK